MSNFRITQTSSNPHPFFEVVDPKGSWWTVSNPKGAAPHIVSASGRDVKVDGPTGRRLLAAVLAVMGD